MKCVSLDTKCTCNKITCNNMKQCERCLKINPADIHTCTPGMRNADGSWIISKDYLKKQGKN